MVYYCCIPGCNNNSKSWPIRISFHRIPKAERVRQQWRRKLDQKFPQENYLIRIFKPNDRVCGPHKQALLDQNQKYYLPNIDVGSNVTINSSNNEHKSPPRIFHVHESFEARSNGECVEKSRLLDHTYCLPPKVCRLQQTIEEQSKLIAELKEQLKNTRIENDNKNVTITKLRQRNEELEENMPDICADQMETQKLRFYTGFINHNLYDNFR